jgi:hypothetical protein
VPSDAGETCNISLCEYVPVHVAITTSKARAKGAFMLVFYAYAKTTVLVLVVYYIEQSSSKITCDVVWEACMHGYICTCTSPEPGPVTAQGVTLVCVTRDDHTSRTNIGRSIHAFKGI